MSQDKKRWLICKNASKLERMLNQQRRICFEVENGAFFSFGNEQFKEKADKDIKYFSMGAGLICPKSTADKLVAAIANITEAGIKQDVKENGAEKIMEREYFNYETQITCDNISLDGYLSDYIRLFPEEFKTEKRNQVYNDCLQLAIKNDWF